MQLAAGNLEHQQQSRYYEKMQKGEDLWEEKITADYYLGKAGSSSDLAFGKNKPAAAGETRKN